MANSLGIDIRGKTVIMEGDGPQSARMVKVNEGPAGGFGSHPDLRGTAVFGIHTATGEEIKVDGYEIESIYDDNNRGPVEG